MLPVWTLICIQRCVEPHRTVKQLALPPTASCNSNGEKNSPDLHPGDKSACLSARCFAKLDVLAPLVITDLKHHLQTGFVVSMGLPLVSAMYFHILLLAYAFSASLGQSAGALVPISAVSVSLCSVTVCHRKTMPTLTAGSEKAERSCTHRHTALLLH